MVYESLYEKPAADRIRLKRKVNPLANIEKCAFCAFLSSVHPSDSPLSVQKVVPKRQCFSVSLNSSQKVFLAN
jgi:hypothetical protein